jgi:hypothetical protein
MHAQALHTGLARVLTVGAVGLLLWGPVQAQSTAAEAAAAGGGSTSANGGTGGVGLGGTGPGVGVRPNASGGAGRSEAGVPGDGALVGPRARRDAQELLQSRPAVAASAPQNAGQRAILLDLERRPAAAPQPATR